MFTLDELLHPITSARFLADYDGRKPLHVPAAEGGRKRELLTWDAFNYLLNQNGLWTSQNLRLMRDHQAVPPEQFCKTSQTPFGPVVRPWPAKVQRFLSAGASLVANDVLYLHPPLTQLGAVLGETFGAGIGANIYCSFQGVRAFGTHYDQHDVFAVQTEGQKIWNLYQNQADRPMDNMADTAATRRWFEQTRGPLMTRVTMKPGDVLYLPRGWYHDALAEDGPSLHVTFSVTPLYGRILLTLLDNAAMQDSRFRAWLPPANRDGGAALKTRLGELGQLLADLVATPTFLDEVAMSQVRVAPRASSFALPLRQPTTLYQTTGRGFPRTADTGLSVVYDWAVSERRFAFEDVVAAFDFMTEAALRDGLDAAVQAGALQKL